MKFERVHEVKHDRLTQLIAAGVMAVAFAVSGVLAVQINASSGRNRLVYTEVAEQGDPPEVALGIAMGAFRGIFVNYLWMRANDLKEEGKYWEAIELSKAITRLQPRFPRVWVFHAWNMAYNISVKTQTPEERWSWVQAGIRLLRDQAIPANPTDLLLHKELAWIYLHKVQAYADDAHPVYKRRVAQEFTIVVGEPPMARAAMLNHDQATAAYAEWFGQIANAATTLQEVIDRQPATRDLLSGLVQAIGEESRFQLLQRWEVAKAVQRSGQRGIYERQLGPKSTALQKLVDDPRYDAAWKELIPHLRKRVLVDDYHYEPERMLRYMRKYGPLDWRHAAAHAVYWSARGVELSLPRFTEANRNNFDFVNVDRVTIQAIQELARSGQVYFNFLEAVTQGGSTYLSIPDIHFVETYGKILDELVSRSWADTDKRAYSFYSAGYENFLIDQIRFRFRRGEVDEAERLYSTLRTFPGQNMNDPDKQYKYSRPLAQFVDEQLEDRQTSPDVARSEIVGSLQQALVVGLLGGNTEVFRREREFAKQQHRYYFEQQGRANNVTGDQYRMELFDKDFNIFEGQVFSILIQNVGYEESQLMYGRAPDELRVYAYDMIVDRYRPAVLELMAQGGKSFELLYPEPPGMAEHRLMMQQQAASGRARLQNEQK
jgi:hypothetical protein